LIETDRFGELFMLYYVALGELEAFAIEGETRSSSLVVINECRRRQERCDSIELWARISVLGLSNAVREVNS
jgi:hypothetical protein